MLDARLLHARTADEQRRDGEHTDLGMGGIGGEVADVLQINDHAEAREHGGDDHRDHAGALDIDARVARDLHILTDRAHILTELGAGGTRG